MNRALDGSICCNSKRNHHHGTPAAVTTEIVGVVLGDTHNAIVVVNMFQLVGPQRQRQMFDVPTFHTETHTLRHSSPYEVLHIVGSEHDLGLRISAYQWHIWCQEDALHMHHVESLGLQHLAKPLRKGFTAISLHVVRLAAEQCHACRHSLDTEVHVHRLDTGGLSVGLWQPVCPQRMLVGLHRQHLHLTALAQQPLCDAVHSHRAAVNRRIRGLYAELEDFHES